MLLQRGRRNDHCVLAAAFHHSVSGPARLDDKLVEDRRVVADQDDVACKLPRGLVAVLEGHPPDPGFVVNGVVAADRDHALSGRDESQ